jgi:hypothetical protein
MCSQSTKQKDTERPDFLQEVVTGRLPYSERKTDPYVTLAVIGGILPQRPAELSINSRFGDQRWAMLVECWHGKADRRPKANYIRNMVGGRAFMIMD